MYQRPGDTSALEEQGVEVISIGSTYFYFDLVKLIMYTIYFGKQQVNDFVTLYKDCLHATSGDYFMLLWNGLVSYFNIGNFILFMALSSVNVNTILRENNYVNSLDLSNNYQVSQLYDSILVLMNMLMLIQFTVLSRRVSMVFKVIGITGSYLMYLVVSYLFMLLLMSLIAW